MHVNLLKLYPYACKLTDINSGCIQTYEAYRFTVTYISLRDMTSFVQKLTVSSGRVIFLDL